MERKKRWISYLYLVLSIAGAILPTIANIEFVKEFGPGFDFKSFIAFAFINPASKSLSFDLLILSSAVFIWMFIESRRLGV